MTRTTLPSADAPLLLADGSVAAPIAAQTMRSVVIPSNSVAQRIVSSTNRKLADLPLPPKQMNAYGVILMYTASGLSDSEISVATKLNTQQIAMMREQPAYTQLEEYVTAAVLEQSKSAVAGVLINAEVKAAEAMVGMIAHEDPKIALAASKDVLDRRGHAPKQQVDIRQQMMSTLRIEVVDKRNTGNIIDVEID